MFSYLKLLAYAVLVSGSSTGCAWASHDVSCIWTGTVASEPTAVQAIDNTNLGQKSIQFQMRITASEKPKMLGRNDSSCTFSGAPEKVTVSLLDNGINRLAIGQKVRVLYRNNGDKNGSNTSFTLL